MLLDFLFEIRGGLWFMILHLLTRMRQRYRRHKFYGSPSKFEINNYKKRNIKIK